MSERHPRVLLEDIIESAEKIFKYTGGLTYEEFITDSKTIDAVIRNFEIIGEASNRLPQEFKDNHNTIDWFKIRGFRNRIVHHYFGIDYEFMWALKDTHLFTLVSEIQNILAQSNL